MISPRTVEARKSVVGPHFNCCLNCRFRLTCGYSAAADLDDPLDIECASGPCILMHDRDDVFARDGVDYFGTGQLHTIEY